jgi:pimeloyl-ACP methyl ester carboxylesterase
MSPVPKQSLMLRKLLAPIVVLAGLGWGAAAAAEKPSIVLVHGLWADGSCYNAIIPSLEAAGYNVIAVQNPLSSLKDDVDAVKRAIDRAGGPVVLVGHSYGGFVITAAGVDERVKGLVYIAALGPDKDENATDLASKFPTPQLNAHLAVVDGYVWVNKDGVKYFAGDLPQKTQDTMFATQGPASGGLFVTKLEGDPAWKTKPSWYVVAKNDNTINPDLELFMSKRMGATTVEVASSHVTMLSHPALVVDLIEKAAKAAEK